MNTYTGFDEFARLNSDLVFRYWVYRKVYTPYETSHQFEDESWFEDIYCNRAYIRDVIKLPDRDVLIGFEDAERADDAKGTQYIEYYKLSEIRLSWSERDNSNDNDNSEDDDLED